MGQSSVNPTGTAAAAAPVTLLRRQAPLTVTPAAPPAIPDHHASVPVRSAMPAAEVSLTGPEAILTADVTVNDQGVVVGADGQPYGGIALTYDPAGDRVLDGQKKPIDVAQIGNRPSSGKPVAAALNTRGPQGDLGLILNDQQQLVTPDGNLYAGRDLRYDAKSDQILDAQGQVVDPATLSGWDDHRQARSDDASVVRNIRIGAAAAGGTAWAGVTYLRYRSSLTGLQGRVASLKATNRAFAAGTSLQGRLAGNPVARPVVQVLQNRRVGKVASMQRAISAELSTHTVQPGAFTRFRNFTRGRVVPTALFALDAYGVYSGVKGWNAPGNERKWDDSLRIGGNGVSAVGNLMTLKRGDIRAGLATNLAGLVISTVGRMADDQN